MKTAKRRFGAETSASRAALIMAGIEVLQEQGASGFTARRVAEKAGLKPQLIHYYFRTIEDLIIAIVRHVGAEGLKRTVRAAASDRPLLELWNACNNEAHAAVTAEIKAFAQHSEAVRTELVRFMEQYRTLMAEAIEHHFEKIGVPLTRPPIVVAMILDALTRMLVSEKALDSRLGHDVLEREIMGWLQGFYKIPSAADVDRTAA